MEEIKNPLTDKDMLEDFAKNIRNYTIIKLKKRKQELENNLEKAKKIIKKT